MEANLLISYDPTHAGKAQAEIEAVFSDVGEKPEFLKSDIEGLFLMKTKSDPKELVKKASEICKKDSSKFECTFHWVPIDKWVKSSVSDMQKVMKDINNKLNPEESWKLDLNKRQYEGKTTDLIMQLTENIDKPKVDLSNPQKIVKVEIIGKKAGISLLDPSEILDAPRIKAGK